MFFPDFADAVPELEALVLVPVLVLVPPVVMVSMDVVVLCAAARAVVRAKRMVVSFMMSF
jgi:hypothetical protein